MKSGSTHQSSTAVSHASASAPALVSASSAGPTIALASSTGHCLASASTAGAALASASKATPANAFMPASAHANAFMPASAHANTSMPTSAPASACGLEPATAASGSTDKAAPLALRSLELFCGAGGLALGLGQAGFAHEGLFERDSDCCRNIADNIQRGCPLTENWKIFRRDVREIDWLEMGFKAGELALISGGPPCQPFSVGGRAKACDDARDMFPEAVRAVRQLQPQAFVFENVQGLLRPAFASYFKYILLQLTWPSLVRKPDQNWEQHLHDLKAHDEGSHGSAEYQVAYRLYNAADFGVPQVRQRVFITGIRADLNMAPELPEPTHAKEALLYSKWGDGSYWQRHGLKKPTVSDINIMAINKVSRFVQDNPHIKPWRTVRDAIGDLPCPLSPEAAACNCHEFRDGARAYAGHTGSLPDAPSKTIKAGVHGVPGGENMITLDDGSLRYFTVRESARIQTFPDDYHFHSSWTESMRQIGNAVPVMLAAAVGRTIFSVLSRADRSHS